MSDFIIKQLNKYDEIIFGPFIGELGWEIYRWAGFVKKYKRLNPHKKIIVCTRDSRQDLYNNAVDDIEIFTIKGDYTTYKPNCYGCNITGIMYKNILNALIQRHPNAFIFEPRVYKTNKRLLSQNDMDFNFTPRKTNFNTIQDILNIDRNRIPIVIASRERKDINKRNWGKKNWKTLFDLIHTSQQYLVFIAGIRGSYVRSKHPFMYCLEDFVVEENSVSTIGLMIEAIKHSKLTVGSQSASIILSNLLGIPTLFWGHEITRHQKLENPRNTKCKGILDRKYNVEPVRIFKEIKQLTR